MQQNKNTTYDKGATAMNNKGTFRKKKVYFSQVSNTALRDNNLSLKAKGLYALIQSYITIEGFTLYKTTLIKQCSEGKKAFDSAWKELKEAGYLKQYRLQGEKGYYYYEYDLLDVAEKEEEEDCTKPENPCNTKKAIHVPKKEGVDNSGGRKGGIYNKTEKNNTNFNNTNKDDDKEQSSIIINQQDIDSFSQTFKEQTKKNILLTIKQKQKLQHLIDEYGYEVVVSVLAKVNESKYLTSNMTINHFLTIDTFIKIANDEYKDREAVENKKKATFNNLGDNARDFDYDLLDRGDFL